MKPLHLFLILLLALMPSFASAQKVPDEILNKLIKTYTDKGMKLERSYLPDFSKVHPCLLMYYSKCYPGKRIVIATVTAAKPSDWYFKASYKSQTAEKTHVINEQSFGGKSYWFDWIMTGFPGGLSDPSEYCMTLVAYDKNSIDVPVYMYIFSSSE